jgi:hypothetical protein
MRRLGIIVLVLGLVGFVMTSREHGFYQSGEGKTKAAVSSEERKKSDTWETLRWVSLGIAVFGAILVVFPGKKAV